MTATLRIPIRFRLDPHSGVPAYRQIIHQVQGGLASGALVAGDRLPTVRQLAVDLAVNANTVLRAYRELEIRGVLDSQQGTGTFIADRNFTQDEPERGRRLDQLVTEFVARAGAGGFTIQDLMSRLSEIESGKKGQ